MPFGASLEEDTVAELVASLELEAGATALEAGVSALDAGVTALDAGTTALEVGVTSALEAGASALDAGFCASALEVGTASALDAGTSALEAGPAPPPISPETEEELKPRSAELAASELDAIPGIPLFGFKLGAVEASSPQFMKAREPATMMHFKNFDFILYSS
jgi:hypothetical protein